MSRVLTLAMVTAILGCAGSPDDDSIRRFQFGPYDIAPGFEDETQCVQLTLHNADFVYVNSVELTTGPGFHHSNWFFVPETSFIGDDGTFTCDDRNWNLPVAALLGGVLFTQSTQASHELQQFPPGVTLRIPPRSKLVAQLHLLNASDAPLAIRPTIELVTLPEAKVTTVLAGVSFQNQALALPPNRESRFVTECDIASNHVEMLGRAPDFKIYYAIAHYHALGTRMTLEAVRSDGSTATVYTTAAAVGDSLGGPIDPLFDMTGFTKLRLSCDYYNPRAQTVRWGIGDQEMCVFLAFSDSPRNFGGGINMIEDPQNETQVGSAMHYTNTCTVFSSPVAN